MRLAFLLVFLTFGAIAVNAAPVLYTYDLVPSTRIDDHNIAARRAAWDEMHLVAAVQGIVNRADPRLYATLVGPRGQTDQYWLKWLRSPGEWLEKAQLSSVAGPEDLVKTFRHEIRGAVLWDARVPATSNVASTVSGVEDLVPIRYDPSPGSLYNRLVADPGGPRLPVIVRLLNTDGTSLFTGQGKIPGSDRTSTGSPKCDAYLWAADRYLKTKRCDATRLGYYPDAYWITRTLKIAAERTLVSNHDFYIAHRGFFFDLSPWDDEAPDDDKGQPVGTDQRTLTEILRDAYEASGGKVIQVGGFTPWDQKYTDFTGGKHGGVATEWRYAEILSCFNAYMDADAPGLHAMANASLYQHYPVADRYPQTNIPTEAQLRERGWIDANGQVAAKTFVSIYVGDYDSSAWLYERMPDLWDDPARGSVPMGWAFNPTLQNRFPVGLVYARKTATPNDTFITGDSGAGYLNPGYLDGIRKWSGLPSGLEAWVEHSEPYYRRWDLRVTGFVIDGNAPGMDLDVKKAYARFSPGGVVAQKIPEISLVDGTPFLRMGPDITGNPEKGADLIANHAPRKAPGFAIYRTILWSPGGHKAMFERLKQLRPDIEVVEPNTLFLLLKHYLTAGNR